MKRNALDYLLNWVKKTNRKPLVIRGARQVGKSYLVRLLAQENKMDLFEINLELNEEYLECFHSKDPKEIIPLLELKAGKKIVDGKTLLFLDEIQIAPELLGTLRYFYELRPDLHVITAGSLLDFILEEHQFSMPVGRIEYLHLGPMTFKEFLQGVNKTQLKEYIESYQMSAEMPDVVHRELMKQFKFYLGIGGMPEAIQTYLDSGSFLDVDAIKQTILLTYRDDFSKYGKRVNQALLKSVFQKLPSLVGKKIKYVNLDRYEKTINVKKVLHQLELAKIYYPVCHSAANGIPLRAESNEKHRKPLFLDVGLFTKACGLNYEDINAADEITLVNSGAVSEQFIGQHLLYSEQLYEEPELFYWNREKRQSSSEINFVISMAESIIPIEVKAGKTGTLKSLNVFLKEKGLDFGVRFNTDKPSICDARFSLAGSTGTFRLLSLPSYMIEELRRIIKTV